MYEYDTFGTESTVSNCPGKKNNISDIFKIFLLLINTNRLFCHVWYVRQTALISKHRIFFYGKSENTQTLQCKVEILTYDCNISLIAVINTTKYRWRYSVLTTENLKI